MKLRSLMALSVVSVGLLACGGDDAPDGKGSNETAQTEPQALNGCGAADFVDASEDDAVVQIAADGLSFTPPCITVAAGQTLRFEGSLTAHPIAPGNADDAEAGSPDNPITATSSGSSVEFTFDSAGTYPYYCELHSFGAGMGMAGAVYVR
jgi:plastocyanin